MKNYILTNRQIVSFRRHLKQEEREQSTIEKYVRDVRLFEAWLSGRRVTDWKNYLRTKGYKPETINAKLSALNKFFAFMRWLECRIKYLKIQKKLFRGTEKELTKGDYMRLLETADTLRSCTNR